MRKDCGFTAMEVVIAVAVLAILAAVSLPSYEHFLQSRRLDGAVQRVVGDLRHAQSLAIALGGQYRLHSGAEPGVNQPGRYRIERSIDGGMTWTGATPWYALASEFPGTAIAGVRDSAVSPQTLYEVRFDARGGCANCSGTVSPPVVLTISRSSGARTVRVALIGAISVQ